MSPPVSPPTTTRRYRRPILIAGAAAVATIAAVAVGFTFVQTGAPPTPNPPPTTSSEPAPAPPTPIPPPPPPAPDPGTELQQQAAADSATAESLVGTWVPQVSSKRDGLVADGITYDDAAIWADFERSRNDHGNAILVNSSDYTSFRLPGYWVTLIAQPYPSAGEANAWCNQEGYDVNNCYAKRLSHTDGATGNTVPRG
jgi:serine/threonine-protein kinase